MPLMASQGHAMSALSELIVIDTEKGQYYEFDRSIKGLKTLDLMGSLIQKALADLPIAKRMRWGASRDEFVRPVQWFILSLGSDLIDIELFDLPNSHQSRGHRFHSQSAHHHYLSCKLRAANAR